MHLVDSRAGGSAGPHEKENPPTFYAVRFPNPTRALSPRQLPTDHDHAVPAREYQSDQSSLCSWAVIGPAVQNQRSKLTSGNVFPPSRPSKLWWMPERCSRSRVRFAAPNNGAPLTTARRSGEM